MMTGVYSSNTTYLLKLIIDTFVRLVGTTFLYLIEMLMFTEYSWGLRPSEM